jgi:hypothetical protein
MLLGKILSSIEGEFFNSVIGVEVVSISDEVGSLSTISVMLLGEILSSIEGEFFNSVIGVEVVSFVPVKFTE